MNDARLVAVLGYANRLRDELHDVTATRLARACAEARPVDSVLLTGAARRLRRVSQAELMAREWRGDVSRVLLDPTARSTYGNALATAGVARDLAVSEVVLVTSGWHARRASALVRAALRGSGRRVVLVATDERGTVATRLRELACWTFVPLLAAMAARRR